MFSRQSMEDAALKVLYVGCALLCFLMVLWIFVLPASVFEGTLPGREGKYSDHPAVRLTHQLPGGIWCIAIAFQLHPGFRKAHRQWHRRMGYACLTSAATMMVGFVLIEVHKLDYMHTEYKDLPLDEAVSDLGMGWLNPLLFLRVLAVLFLAAAGLALRAILRRDVHTHRKWMLRHAALGLWIAVHRVYVVGVAIAGGAREQRKAAFGDGIYVGLATTVIGAELAIWIYDGQQKRQEQEPGGKAPFAASGAEMTHDM